MALLERARFKPVLLLIIMFLQLACAEFQTPTVKIEKLKPKGIRVSIPDVASMTFFAFQGHLNREIKDNEVGTISGEVENPENGRWSFEDKNVEVKTGDVLYYYIYVSVDKSGYVKDKLSYTFQDKPEVTSEAEDEVTDCTQSITEVRGMRNQKCTGEVIFEDNFASLKEDTWLIEQKIPLEHPEHPFVSYQRSSVSVEDGHLTIKPQLLQFMPHYTNDSLYSGTLDLYDGCTESANSCYMIASGANILPPIVSGRVSSKGFAFKYGTVTIRAKIPKGDWLYPELLLEPFMYKYGKLDYASGVIKIASARGNNEMYKGRRQFGNNVLYGGPIMDLKCHETFLKSKVLKSVDENWGDVFHNYTVRWEPERIVLLVDEQEWGRIDVGDNGFKGQISGTTCPNAPFALWAKGKKNAPFDEFFYLTLGLAAGGILEFEDGTFTTDGHPKPYNNFNSKGQLRFWEDIDTWHASWNKDSALIVDHVTIKAL